MISSPALLGAIAAKVVAQRLELGHLLAQRCDVHVEALRACSRQRRLD